MSNEIFQRWQDGEITDMEALRALCSDYGELESELKPLERQKEDLRRQIEQVVCRFSGPVVLPGFGQVEITAPGRPTPKYDAKALDALVQQLTSDGYGPIAQQIQALRSETSRSGSLRITPEKEKK